MSSPDTALGTKPVSLHALARESIARGLETHAPLEIEPAGFASPLREPGASFVTLRIEGALRGCTGTLAATRPLVSDVSHNAFRSAYRDPRFRPVDASEIPRLDVHVAVLSSLAPLPAASEAALLEALRPGVDGLVLREGARTATFLPAVWESLPNPIDFLRELKRKAHLPDDHWSDRIEVQRYTTETARPDQTRAESASP
jgi:AmmeMemoRadiSam system protein A